MKILRFREKITMVRKNEVSIIQDEEGIDYEFPSTSADFDKCMFCR